MPLGGRLVIAKSDILMDDIKPAEFIPLGSPQGVAITSLDTYIELRKQDNLEPPLEVPEYVDDNIENKIKKLQLKQSKLYEELNKEKRRGENLKSTFNKAVSLSVEIQEEKLTKIRKILQDSADDSKVIQRAIQFILTVLDNQQNSENAVNAEKEAQSIIDTELENEKNAIRMKEYLDKKLQQTNDEIDELKLQIEEAQSTLNEATESRIKLKDKMKKVIGAYKKKEAAYKEKCETLEAEVDVLQ
ncbi:hypothetical protein GPJ56_004120 [Histomonas meleagridis]|uniref:uncharacterized protein n=1 Tax=Histomonas meleagridis TaxID=135588 RepID=UPI003559D163|nr:hypothetical protein GPJ56_004120 [Histomonas meleagridis]KAH0801461.1 hypothetical protein GO595_005713 [Histomonas meleagridis]